MSAFSSRFGRGHFGLNTQNVGPGPNSVTTNQWTTTANTASTPNFANPVVASLLRGKRLSGPPLFALDTQTNSRMVHGPEANFMTTKFRTPRNPLVAEGSNPNMEAPPQIMFAEKEKMYADMIAKAKSPAEVAAIQIAHKTALDQTITKEVNADFVKSFQNWIMKRGRKLDHVRAGWWNPRDAQPPKFLRDGGLLSAHPTVTSYVDNIVLSRPNFEHELLRLKVEAATAGVNHWPIDKLYVYYKYVVRGLEPDEGDYGVLLGNGGPGAPFVGTGTSAAAGAPSTMGNSPNFFDALSSWFSSNSPPPPISNPASAPAVSTATNPAVSPAPLPPPVPIAPAAAAPSGPAPAAAPAPTIPPPAPLAAAAPPPPDPAAEEAVADVEVARDDAAAEAKRKEWAENRKKARLAKMTAADAARALHREKGRQSKLEAAAAERAAQVAEAAALAQSPLRSDADARVADTTAKLADVEKSTAIATLLINYLKAVETLPTTHVPLGPATSAPDPLTPEQLANQELGQKLKDAVNNAPNTRGRQEQKEEALADAEKLLRGEHVPGRSKNQ